MFTPIAVTVSGAWAFLLVVGLTLLSWTGVMAPLLVVGGVAMFLIGLLAPHRRARRIVEDDLVLEEAGDTVLDLRDPAVAGRPRRTAGSGVPSQREYRNTTSGAR